MRWLVAANAVHAMMDPAAHERGVRPNGVRGEISYRPTDDLTTARSAPACESQTLHECVSRAVSAQPRPERGGAQIRSRRSRICTLGYALLLHPLQRHNHAPPAQHGPGSGGHTIDVHTAV